MYHSFNLKDAPFSTGNNHSRRLKHFTGSRHKIRRHRIRFSDHSGSQVEGSLNIIHKNYITQKQPCNRIKTVSHVNYAHCGADYTLHRKNPLKVTGGINRP